LHCHQLCIALVAGGMYRFSPQTSSISSLPTLLGSSYMRQELLQSTPKTTQLHHSQSHRQKQNVASYLQSPCLSPRVTVAGGCLSFQTIGIGGCRTPQTPGALAQSPLQGLPPTCGFSTEDLHVGMGGNDPTQEPLRSQILTRLGLPKQARVERLGGNCGGLNKGLWAVQDPSSRSSLVLKLVQSRCAYGAPSEAEKFARIFREHPTIENDPAVAFPIKVFKCIGHTGNNSHDFVVMRKVNGQPLGDVLALKHSMGQMQDIKRILHQFGSFLAKFHKTYSNKQHGDLQPSNIFYDASSGAFALIDVADLGYNSLESDVSHFSQSLRILSSCFGQDFYSHGKHNFEEGYRGFR